MTLPEKRKEVDLNGANLDILLTNLTAFGKPRINHTGEGWVAFLAMHVSSKGVTFDIRSEFGKDTPMLAVQQLIARLKKTLKDME